MSSPAGDYPDRLRHRPRTLGGTPGSNGEKPISYPDGALLWGAVDVQSSRRESAWGSEQTGSYVVVRLRQYPSVRAEDRLYSAEWGEVYKVDSVRRGDNEIICECSYWDEQVA